MKKKSQLIFQNHHQEWSSFQGQGSISCDISEVFYGILDPPAQMKIQCWRKEYKNQQR